MAYVEQARDGSNPYFLSYTPTRESLTVGTSIPAPSSSPPLSPFARPPTPGGGPLSSHPTTPIDLAHCWSPPFEWSSSSNVHTPPKSSAESAVTSSTRTRNDSAQSTFRQPLTPASANTQRRDSSKVKRLLSLSSFRNSFSSSRTSLLLSTPPPSTDNTPEYTTNKIYTYQGTKRPSSPSIFDAESRSPVGRTPQLRKRKSGFFGFSRRKSGLFMFDSVDDAENDRLDKGLEGNDNSPKTAATTTPAPMLPRVKGITNGALDGDDIFATVGR